MQRGSLRNGGVPLTRSISLSARPGTGNSSPSSTGSNQSQNRIEPTNQINSIALQNNIQGANGRYKGSPRPRMGNGLNEASLKEALRANGVGRSHSRLKDRLLSHHAAVSRIAEGLDEESLNDAFLRPPANIDHLRPNSPDSTQDSSIVQPDSGVSTQNSVINEELGDTELDIESSSEADVDAGNPSGRAYQEARIPKNLNFDVRRVTEVLFIVVTVVIVLVIILVFILPP